MLPPVLGRPPADLEQKKAPIGTATLRLGSVPQLDVALKLAGVSAVKGLARGMIPALSLKAWQVAVGSSMVAPTPAEAPGLSAVEKSWLT